MLGQAAGLQRNAPAQNGPMSRALLVMCLLLAGCSTPTNRAVNQAQSLPSGAEAPLTSSGRSAALDTVTSPASESQTPTYAPTPSLDVAPAQHGTGMDKAGEDDFAEAGGPCVGSTTQVGDYSYTRGTDPHGSSCSSTTTQIGDYGYTRGSSSNGTTYSETTTRIGDYSYGRGTDSEGNAYSSTTTHLGGYHYSRGSGTDGSSYSSSAQRQGDYSYGSSSVSSPGSSSYGTSGTYGSTSSYGSSRTYGSSSSSGGGYRPTYP